MISGVGGGVGSGVAGGVGGGVGGVTSGVPFLTHGSTMAGVSMAPALVGNAVVTSAQNERRNNASVGGNPIFHIGTMMRGRAKHKGTLAGRERKMSRYIPV